MFTWDEAKRQENLDKHGIDFFDARVIFAGCTVSAEDAREAYGEQRFLTLGLLRGEVVSVAHTPREDNDHIIRSARLRNMKRASTSRKSRTDVKRLKSMKDSDIVIDKDAPAWTPDMFARAIVRKGLEPVAKKSLLSLRIDADVLEWFRSQGRGYQSRMNALLRAYMKAHK
jgi:uncharacterized protein (DUF4415 family)